MNKIENIFHVLLNHFGKQNWWPAETFDEMVIGAILVQNTNWKNAEKAIMNLKNLDLCSLKYIRSVPHDKLAKIIKPSGFYNLKAERLTNAASQIPEIQSELPIYKIRDELLKINGIGKETADSIILYGYNKPIFVVDSYTKRAFSRIGLFQKNITYDQVQTFFHKNINPDTSIYNEYHALIVKLAKTHCLRKPQCHDCPINQDCDFLNVKNL